MTATDELRRLLDERGVEWIQGRVSSDSTAWLDGGAAVVADEYGDGLLLVERKMTPEQAIEATLGSDLHAENAKLRELVRDMWRGAMQRMDYAERYAFAGEFVDRMRELGVEVDD